LPVASENDGLSYSHSSFGGQPGAPLTCRVSPTAGRVVPRAGLSLGWAEAIPIHETAAAAVSASRFMGGKIARGKPRRWRRARVSCPGRTLRIGGVFTAPAGVKSPAPLAPGSGRLVPCGHVL